MNEYVKAFLYFVSIITIGTAFIFIIFQLQQTDIKAQKYEIYKDIIKDFEQCYPVKPVVLCPNKNLNKNLGGGLIEQKIE